MMLMVVFLLLALHHFSAKLIQTDFRVIFFFPSSGTWTAIYQENLV